MQVSLQPAVIFTSVVALVTVKVWVAFNIYVSPEWALLMCFFRWPVEIQENLQIVQV